MPLELSELIVGREGSKEQDDSPLKMMADPLVTHLLTEMQAYTPCAFIFLTNVGDLAGSEWLSEGEPPGLAGVTGLPRVSLPTPLTHPCKN